MAFEEFGLPFEISEEDLTKNNSIIQIGVAPIRIDILTDIDGVNFDEAYKKKIEHNFGKLVASVINIDDIIKNKTASNRAKDKIDIIELKKLKKSLK